MGSAIGNSSSGRDHGSHVYDIRDFGAVAKDAWDGPMAIANTAAFQLAYDTAHANLGANNGATVYVPSGIWHLATPVFVDRNYVGFRGDGARESNIYNGGCNDIFVLGIQRQPNGVPATPDHFPDAWTGGPGGTPVYDATAVTSLGQRWGIRTKADSHVCQQGGPLDRGPGDGYRTTRVLTIATYVDFTLSPVTIPPGKGAPMFPGSGSLMGMVLGNVGNPWVLTVNSGNVTMSFTTVDVNGLNRAYYTFVVYHVPASPGLVKLDIQIDLVNAQVSVYVNGIQTTANPVGTGSFTAAAGMYFITNNIYPFGIGSTRETMDTVYDQIGGIFDCTFWGLKITTALIYTNRNTAGTNDGAGNGTTQTRLDATAITDYKRYFGWEGLSEICRLTFQDSPAAIGVNSLITVTMYNVPTTTNAFFCDNAKTGNSGLPMLGAFFEGIGFGMVNPTYGRCLAIGTSYNLRVSHCNFNGGNQNIGAINVNTNYPCWIEYCEFNSLDACIYLHYTGDVTISHCTFGNAMVHIRLYNCNARIEYCFISSQGHPDYNIWCKGGGILDAAHIAQDAEGGDGGPAKAMVYADGNAGGFVSGLGANVKLEFLISGRQVPGSALVVLEDGAPEDGGIQRTCRFAMAHCHTEDNYATTMVRNNGQRWRGTVVASTTLQRPTWIENTDVTGQGNVVSIHDHFIGVPRDGTWGKNANILKVPTPAIAQFAEWRCTKTGSYGTATPPLWYGLLPIDDGLSLAAYIQDNTYWAAPSMPVSGQGFWSDYPMSLFLNALFGGAMPATPTGLYVGAAARQSFRNGVVVEMGNSGGYTRVPTGAWTLAGAGATNAAPITFPTATANWNLVAYYNTISSLVFYDAPTYGHFVGAVDIPTASVLNGQTLSYAAGALTVARASSPLGSCADSIHAKMNGFWLNQAVFTVPTIYIALSTAPASLAAPIEPSGGSYARLATSAATWARNPVASYSGAGSLSTIVIVSNALPLTFAAPTADWGPGSILSVYLMDALSGGNVLGSANLTVPRTILSGSPARSFAAGALWISRS